MKKDMIMENIFYKKLCEINGLAQVHTQEPMKRHTTFRVGGNAGYFVAPLTPKALWQTIETCREAEEPYYILGNGSNVLVSDQGYPGVIIQLFKNQDKITFEGQRLTAQAGALLIRTAHEAARLSLSGLEFASGIPGTVGGALAMNAGAYGGEIRDVVEKARVLTPEGEIRWLSREELDLTYRSSVISRKSYIALEAVFLLKEGESIQIEARMEELKRTRTEKQPLEYASAGSTFKRPEGYFAGKLIMEAGLRGYRVGGAQVSEKHCGFVINRGDATARDVMDVITHVREEVKRQAGVDLELEVKLLGF